MSYFVGAQNVEGGIAEDGGFAINGGRGWSDVVFSNHQIDLNSNAAVAMGTYEFTDATDGSKTTVEYTFGYKKHRDGKMRIFLHHSSVPYSAPKPSISKEDVLACQGAWASAIKRISKVHKDGGDFVQCAADAASELYGYGYSNVLFKPTKAVDERFRPTGESAMSYFVGAQNVEGGIAEDGGFAINCGRGWSNVVFSNHQIDLNSNAAVAMGTYEFTDATDGSKTTVEYTFGYKKHLDGKVRIFLHHSSVPYSAGSKAAPVTSEEVAEGSYSWGLASKFAAVILPRTGTSPTTFKERSTPESSFDGASKETLRCAGPPGGFPSEASGSSCGDTLDNARGHGGKLAADSDERDSLLLIQKHVEPAHPTDAKAASRLMWSDESPSPAKRRISR
jgi:hypothetical protein